MGESIKNDSTAEADRKVLKKIKLQLYLCTGPKIRRSLRTWNFPDLLMQIKKSLYQKIIIYFIPLCRKTSHTAQLRGISVRPNEFHGDLRGPLALRCVLRTQGEYANINIAADDTIKGSCTVHSSIDINVYPS